MRRHWTWPAWLSLVTLGCPEKAIQPPVDPVVTSVSVTSAVDTILSKGGTSQLTAVARDAGGSTVAGAQVTWSSSSSETVAVSPAGVARAEAAGAAVVTASVPGSSASGSLALRVVEADLPAVTTARADPFSGALVGALSDGTNGTIQAAWNQCGTGAGTGNVVSIVECVAQVRGAAASAAEGTDRALLAVLVLFADHIERQLGL